MSYPWHERQQSTLATLSMRRHQYGDPSISGLGVGEIYDGVLGSHETVRILAVARSYLAPFDLLTVDDSTMLQFPRLRVELRSQGSSFHTLIFW